MRLLRDAFWAIYASAPSADRNASRPERNPLRFFQRLGDLGILGSASRGLQSFDRASERLALEDAIGSIRTVVSEPAFDRLVAKVVDHPTSLGAWADRTEEVPDFRLGTLTFRAFSALAAEKTLRISPAVFRYAESVFGGPGDPLPDSFIGDALVALGTAASDSESTRLHTLRLPDGIPHERLAGLGDFLEDRIFPTTLSLPLRGAISQLDRDREFRDRFFQALRRETVDSARQSDGDSEADSALDPNFDLVLSPEHPELRRAIAAWCGRSAGPYAFELSSRPDEALLMIDGLLDSAESPAFTDFFAALLRELAN
jgi:hypothetical protein